MELYPTIDISSLSIPEIYGLITPDSLGQYVNLLKFNQVVYGFVNETIKQIASYPRNCQINMGNLLKNFSFVRINVFQDHQEFLFVSNPALFNPEAAIFPITVKKLLRLPLLADFDIKMDDLSENHSSRLQEDVWNLKLVSLYKLTDILIYSYPDETDLISTWEYQRGKQSNHLYDSIYTFILNIKNSYIEHNNKILPGFCPY